MPVIYEVLVCEREQHNIHNPFAVAVYKGSSYRCRASVYRYNVLGEVGALLRAKLQSIGDIPKIPNYLNPINLTF